MELQPHIIFIMHGTQRYKAVLEGDHWAVYDTNTEQRIACLEYWFEWRVVEGELDEETLQHIGKNLDAFLDADDEGHHYPQTDEVDKERLEFLIDQAKETPYENKVQLFGLLEQELNAAFVEFDGNNVKACLSKGFTAFEHLAKLLPYQEAAEGFLHWNHMIFFKRFKEMSDSSQLAKMVADALHESKYWLVDKKHNFGVLSPPKH